MIEKYESIFKNNNTANYDIKFKWSQGTKLGSNGDRSNKDSITLIVMIVLVTIKDYEHRGDGWR